jgi:hypothetical protein
MSRRYPHALVDGGARRDACDVAEVVESRILSQTSRMAVCDDDVVDLHVGHDLLPLD